MHSVGILILVCFLASVFCKVTLVNPDKELIFNGDDKIFDEITEINGRCFTACPAVTDDQQEFNRAESITKNSLFLRDSIVSPADYDTSLIECENFYKPSIVVREGFDVFEVGYEVYFNNNEMKAKGLFQWSKSSFSSIAEMKANNKLTNRLLGILSTGFGFKRSNSEKNTKINGRKKIRSDSSSKTSDTDSESDSESMTNNNRVYADEVGEELKSETESDLSEILGLHWIKVFRFYFDIGQCGPIQVEYSTDLGKLNAAYKCEDYSADEVLYENVKFEFIYEQANQVKLFENLPAFPNIPDGQCGQKYGCLKPHQLIPHYYYHSQASKFTTCSAVNTLPIWQRISDGILKKIDRYLYVISQKSYYIYVIDRQIWGPNVTITTGATDTLSYSTASHFGGIFSRKLFMDLANKKVPVPDIIYKIVKFRKGRNEFHVVIVIHNDPLATDINHVCPPDEENFSYQNLLDSWYFVVNKVEEFGLSYPCPMAEKVLNRLKVSRNRSQDLYYVSLSLNELPFADSTKEEKRIDQENLDEVPSANSAQRELTNDEKKQMIEAKVRELFGEA